MKISQPLKLFLVFIFFFLIGDNCLAQYEQLLNKTPIQQAITLDSLYENTIRPLRSPEQALKIANEVYAIGKRYKKKELKLEKDLIMAFYHAVQPDRKEEDVIYMINKLIEKAQKEKCLSVEVRATKLLSDFYWHGMKNYGLSMEIYIRLDWLMQKTTYPDFPW